VAATLEQLEAMIASLDAQGYSLHCGRHYGARDGFFAQFFITDDEDTPVEQLSRTWCRECRQFMLINAPWENAGHAMTLAGAIEMAYYLIVEKENVRVPNMQFFEPGADRPGDWLLNCLPAPRPERERQINLS
jgi:hypothetical protein